MLAVSGLVFDDRAFDARGSPIEHLLPVHGEGVPVMMRPLLELLDPSCKWSSDRNRHHVLQVGGDDHVYH